MLICLVLLLSCKFLVRFMVDWLCSRMISDALVEQVTCSLLKPVQYTLSQSLAICWSQCNVLFLSCWEGHAGPFATPPADGSSSQKEHVSRGKFSILNITSLVSIGVPSNYCWSGPFMNQPKVACSFRYGNHRILFTIVQCSLVGLKQNWATQLTAQAVSGLVLVERYNKLLMTTCYYC